MRKNIDKMTADELFSLAEKRRDAEQKSSLSEIKKALDSKRIEKNKLKAKFDRDFKRLQKEEDKLLKSLARGNQTNGRNVGVGEEVVAILKEFGKCSTKQISTELENRGKPAPNLPQTLAYLKKRAMIKSVSRAIYKAN